MKNKKKVIVIITSLVLVLIVGLVAVGNYFFNYALVRTETGEVGGANREVSAENTTQQKNVEYAKMDEENTDEWVISTPKENVSVESDSLTLRATKFCPHTDSNNWAIILHGYSSNQEKIQSVAMHYASFGFNSLTPDLRAHGKSEGKYIGMGWLDVKDVLKWIDLIINENPESKIVLHGISMGAAAAMMTSSQNLRPNVKCIIEDCGYTSVYDIFSSELKLRFGLPSFPVLDFASLVTKVRAGYSLKEASALEQVKKSVVPILFVHGNDDKFVPVNMGYALYEAAQCKKDILIIPDADHDESRIVDPNTYYKKVQEFIESNGIPSSS